MKSTFTTKTISIYGKKWANQTKYFLETIGLVGAHLSVFKYEHREILFMEQYDVFILTDFEQDTFDKDYQNNLEILRQIVYTRSMKTVIFANINDLDIYKALREAGARVIGVKPIDSKNIPTSFADAILKEYFSNICDKDMDYDLVELVA